MYHLFSRTLTLLGAISLAACGNETANDAVDPACVDAAAHIADCTGVEAGLEGCDAELADAALSMSCDELADAEGKSDCGFFTPWDCWNFSGGDSSTDHDSAIVVHVTECMPGALDSCAGVTSAPCTHVQLLDAAGQVVGDDYTSSHGGALFENLEDEMTYTVRVLRRDGTVAQAQLDQWTNDFGPAEATATVDRWEETRVDFSLEAGETELTRACATVEFQIDVVEPDGTRVDPEEIEWDWIAAYDDANGPQLSRAYRFYEGPDANTFTIHNMPLGAHEILFHRVSIPATSDCNWYYIGGELHFGGQSWYYSDECRLPNRNEQLLEHFAVDDIQPIAVTLEIDADDLGSTIRTNVVELTDPVPGL